MIKQKIIETNNIRNIQTEIDNGWRVVQMISQSVSSGSHYIVERGSIIVLLEKNEIDVPFSKFKESEDERYRKVKWFYQNYYETGMEFESLLATITDDDLENGIKWYDKIIQFPKNLK